MNKLRRKTSQEHQPYSPKGKWSQSSNFVRKNSYQSHKLDKTPNNLRNLPQSNPKSPNSKSELSVTYVNPKTLLVRPNQDKNHKENVRRCQPKKDSKAISVAGTTIKMMIILTTSDTIKTIISSLWCRCWTYQSISVLAWRREYVYLSSRSCLSNAISCFFCVSQLSLSKIRLNNYNFMDWDLSFEASASGSRVVSQPRC